MIKNKKLVFITLLFGAIIIIGIIYHEIIGYGLGQAKGQMAILQKVKPVAEILIDKTYPDSIKQSLQLIQEIRQYAEDSLGINHSDNYTTFYDQKGKSLLWNVTACEKYSLKSYEWAIPFLGNFSYKGFFEKEKAEKELLKLQKMDYDTDLYAVSGWSTLGLLKDPILSQWLSYSKGRLANLIIHELTHGTLYIKNDVSYNENLASFVGDLGAKRFLTQKYGADSKELTNYIHDQIDAEVFRSFVLKNAKKLDSLYNSFDATMTIENKEQQKQLFLTNFIQDLQDEEFYNHNYCNYFDKKLPNNTFFMGFMRYYDRQSEFKAEFEQKYDSNFALYMKYLKEKYPHLLN